jgi:hypothetical protein
VGTKRAVPEVRPKVIPAGVPPRLPTKKRA